MDKDVDGDAADGGEGGDHPEGVLRAEAKDVLPLADDDECLPRGKKQ